MNPPAGHSRLPSSAASLPGPLDDAATVHVRCGSDIRAALRRAGFVGPFLEFSDPVCIGPVPAGGSLAAIRAAFLSACTGQPAAELEARLARELAALRRLDRFERAVLWFEHDSYDQLVLARILAELAGLPRLPELSLICIDSHPEVPRLIGLGQLSPAQLAGLWPGRAPVESGLLDLGCAVWAALQEPAPLALHGIAAAGTPELPAMARALHRHLQELPWAGDGLGLTERLALQGLAQGPRSGAALFRDLQNRTEPLPFLGDLLFWRILSDLAAAGRPAIAWTDAAAPWPQRRLELTDTGRALLAGRLDWQDCAPPPRWVGGVQLLPDAGRVWRWDPVRGRPVLAGPAIASTSD